MIDWRHWHNEPHLVGGLIILGWLYALAVGPFRARFAPEGTLFPRNQAILFYASLVVFYLAVGSPLDQIGERFLLTAHMVQHQLVIYPAAVLFLLGLPSWLVGAATGNRALRLVFTLGSRPLICGAVYTLVISFWHFPALYDWALQDKVVHVVEHVTFFGAALFYWWPLLSPSREFPPISYAGQMFYLVAVTISMTPVFAFIAFSTDVLYPTYEYAPRLIPNFDAAQDQLLGAAVMKLGGMAVSFIALVVAFYRWYQTSERPSRPRWRPVSAAPLR